MVIPKFITNPNIRLSPPVILTSCYSGTNASSLFLTFGHARGFVTSFKEWVQKLNSPQIHHNHALHDYKYLYIFHAQAKPCLISLCVYDSNFQKFKLLFLFPFSPPFPMFSNLLLPPSCFFIYIPCMSWTCVSYVWICFIIFRIIPIQMLLLNTSINLKSIVNV